MEKHLRDISTIPELGAYLRTTRQKQEISLDQVEDATKIRNRYIVALEEGNFSQIPGGEVYVRGFLRNYSKALGLDPDEIMAIYGSFKEEKPIRPDYKPPMVDNIEGSDTPLQARPYILPIVILVVIVAGTLLIKNINSAKPNPPPTKNIEPPPPIRDVQPPSEEMDIDSNIDEADFNDTPAIVLLSEEDGLRSTYLVTVEEGLEAELEIVRDRCWVSSTLDGKSGFEGILNQGERQVFRAERYINLRIGNPQVVKLIINEQDMGIPGGASRDFIIERSN